MLGNIERFPTGAQATAGRFYPNSVELETEAAFDEKHRVFRTNTSKREASVRHTDSALRISGSELPYLDTHKLGRIKC